MPTYGEIDMSDYDPQASLEAHKQFEAQLPPEGGVTELHVLTALVVMGLLAVVVTALCLVWALQMS